MNDEFIYFCASPKNITVICPAGKEKRQVFAGTGSRVLGSEVRGSGFEIPG
jgi:hypothetical protein